MAATIHHLRQRLRNLRPAAAGVVRMADGSVCVVVICPGCTAQVRLPTLPGAATMHCTCGEVLADGDDEPRQRAAAA